jgi:hypothetical protein
MAARSSFRLRVSGRDRIAECNESFKRSSTVPCMVVCVTGYVALRRQVSQSRVPQRLLRLLPVHTVFTYYVSHSHRASPSQRDMISLFITTSNSTMEEEDTLPYDSIPDIDGFDYTSHYSAQRPYRTHRYSDREELDPVQGNPLGRLGRFLDFVTGPRFAFVVAIVVILVFQFQGKTFSVMPASSEWSFHHDNMRSSHK